MSGRATSLEPKTQFTINLALRRKKKEKGTSQSKEWEKTKRENSQSKSGRKQKKGERKFPIKDRKKTEEICIKVFWTRQYLNNTDLSPRKDEKKGNHDLKWSSLFDCQPKSCAPVTCSPRAKQNNRKGKGQKHSKPNSHKKYHSQEKVLLIHDHACNL